MPRQTLKQRADKRYRAWYNGKQFYGSTQKEARAKRDEYKRQVEAGMNVAEAGATVGEYCSQWLETYKASVSEMTRASWEAQLSRFCRFRIKKTQIGFIKVKAITPSDIQSFYNSLDGLSQSTISHHVIAVRAVFRSALADRIIQFDPTINAKPPKGQSGTHRAITQEERQLIHTVPHQMRLPALMMLYTGMRRGEMLALNIDRDVDFEEKLIHIRGAVSWKADGTPIYGRTKTDAGIRDVPLLSILIPELKGVHGALLEFPNRYYVDACWDKYMSALSKAAGKKVCFRQHDLRHTYCSMLYTAGVDVKSAQTWMGHATIQITLDVYTHLSEERKTSATEALENEAKKLATVQNTVQLESKGAEDADM